MLQIIMEQAVFNIAPLILVFPVIGVLFNAFFGRSFINADRKIGERWSGWFATFMAISSFVVVVILDFALQGNGHQTVIVDLMPWISIPSFGLEVPWALQIDTLSVTMMLVVTGVGSIIHVYSIGYMHGDENYSRYFTYLNLFLFFMLILVSGSSYLVLFVGWEGVGLCSYLLISFWFARVDKDGVWMNANAGRKAFIVNRVGDFAMVLAIILTFYAFGSVQFNAVFDTAVAIVDPTFEAGHGDAHGEETDSHGEEAADSHGEESADSHGEEAAADSHSEEYAEFEDEELSLFASEGVDRAGELENFGFIVSVITLLFLLAATGKSAQLILHVWLPDAMAGPTPASSLIHAATMVTSGIYLIVRSNVLFEIARASGFTWFANLTTPDIVALVGATTALYAGLIAFTKNDIKKVLAYSTVSQLGFMIAAAGMGAYIAAMFHLITHAFFKALLFMGAGSVIHGMEHGHHDLAHGHDDHGDEHHHEDDGFDPQDMRFMGGLRHKMPWTFWTYLIGALALAGIFPFAGFWSKDEILAHAFATGNREISSIMIVVYIMLTIAAMCTAFYMARQVSMVFFGKPRHEAADHAHESSRIMTIPLVILAFFAVVIGLANLPRFNGQDFAGQGNLVLEHWLEHSLAVFELSEENVLHAPHTPTSIDLNVAGISTGLALLALGLGFFLYRGRPEKATDPDLTEKVPFLWSVFGRLPLDSLYMKVVIPLFNRFAHWLAHTFEWAFWHDFFHNRIIRDTFVEFASFMANVIDKQGVDGIVNGVGSLTKRLAGSLRLSQTGYARTYALSVFLGAILLLIIFLWPLMAG